MTLNINFSIFYILNDQNIGKISNSRGIFTGKFQIFFHLDTMHYEFWTLYFSILPCPFNFLLDSETLSGNSLRYNWKVKKKSHLKQVLKQFFFLKICEVVILIIQTMLLADKMLTLQKCKHTQRSN